MWRSRFATHQVVRWSPWTSLSWLRNVSAHDLIMLSAGVHSYSGSILGFFVSTALTAFYAPSKLLGRSGFREYPCTDMILYRDSKLSTWRSTVTVVSARNVKSPQTTKFSESTVAAGQTSRLVRRCSTSKNSEHYHANAELLQAYTAEFWM